MNVMDYFLMHKECTATVYDLWRKAVLANDREAQAEIRRLISLCIKHCIVDGYPTTGFRARIVYPKDLKDLVLSERKGWFDGPSGLNGFPASKMGAPPKGASPGRANKKNEPVLYLASDVQTACSEVQPSCEALISVAKFSIRNGLRIVDFREVPVEYQVTTNHDEPEIIKTSIFFNSIIELFSMPVSSRELDLYRYSQFIKDRLRSHRIDGIIYQSSHNQADGTYNLVLFNPQNAVCVSECGELYKCLSIKSSFQNISVNSTEQTVHPIEAGRARAPFLWNETMMMLKDFKKQIDGT